MLGDRTTGAGRSMLQRLDMAARGIVVGGRDA